MSEIKKDIVVIGGGPAGLTASIYAKRANKDIAVLEPNLAGGQLNWSSIIENYPGFKSGINGMKLAESMKEQAQAIGVEITASKAQKIESADSNFMVISDRDRYKAKAVILATGAVPKKLNVPGENDFISKGVSYCATCDAPLFKNKVVAVVGGGNVALEEVLYLSEFASKVYLIHRREAFRAAAILEERVKRNEKIELALNKTVEAIEGDKIVKELKLQDKLTNQSKKIDIDGLFIFVGSNPNSEIAGDLAELDKKKFVITDESMSTKSKGLFAAGDVRKKEYRQIVIAASDGAIAGLNASRYINENSN
jgi:thioredoxin reductase (NADPH)